MVRMPQINCVTAPCDGGESIPADKVTLKTGIAKAVFKDVIQEGQFRVDCVGLVGNAGSTATTGDENLLTLVDSSEFVVNEVITRQRSADGGIEVSKVNLSLCLLSSR